MPEKKRSVVDSSEEPKVKDVDVTRSAEMIHLPDSHAAGAVCSFDRTPGFILLLSLPYVLIVTLL